MVNAQSQIPQKGDFFEYQISYGLRDGSGWYSDWWEQTKETGRYEITNVGATITFQANYTWNYSDSEGSHTTTKDSRTLDFNPTTRLYSQYLTDDDEYDSQDGRSLGVWFWVPPNLVS